jgi:ABC-type oligopeptide transport system ATPase subunit
MFIAHDLAVVKYFSDRIGVMYFGKLVELGTSEELFAHPFHPYTRSLLSAIPLPDPLTEKSRTRMTYNPVLDHDYSKEGPSMQEVYPGHFVYCNTEELEKYRKEYEEAQK